jgi:hypothetical protein
METLKKIGDNIYALCRNDHPLQCPYAARLLVPGSVQGTANISAVGCNTLCPLFRANFNPLEGTADVTLCNNAIYKNVPISDQEAVKKPLFSAGL